MPDRGPSTPPDSAASDQPIELAPEPFSLAGSPGVDATPGPARSPVRRILLTGLLVVAAAGVAVLGYSSWQIISQKDATLTAPTQLGPLHLDTSQNGKDTADYLQTALAAEIDLDKPVGAVYTDGTDRDVLFFGGTGLIWSPGKDLDRAFDMIADDQGAVTNLHDVPAGRLGGTMQCGTTKTDAGPIPVCGWADHGALAVAMFPNRTEHESATLLVQLRNAAQSRP